MKTMIGTILAIVTIAVDDGGLLDAAQDHEVEEPRCRSKRRRRRSPCCRRRTPGRSAPSVDLISTQYETLPTQAADPVAEGRQEARDSRRTPPWRRRTCRHRGRACARERLEHARQHLHAAPAMAHAMSAPNGPVAMPKVRGSEKIPAPTMRRPPSRSGRTAGTSACSAPWPRAASLLPAPSSKPPAHFQGNADRPLS